MDCFKLYSLSIFTSLSRDFFSCWNNFLSISFEKITSRMFPKGFGVDLVYLFNGYWVNLKQSLKRPRGNFNKGSWKHLLKREIYLVICHTSNMNVMLFLTLMLLGMFTWYFISLWHLLHKKSFCFHSKWQYKYNIEYATTKTIRRSWLKIILRSLKLSVSHNII